MIFGYLKIEEDKQKLPLKNPVRCSSCYNWIEENSNNCEYCGVFRSFQQPKSWLERFKRWLGIEISSELIVLSIEEPVNFFSDAEIDTILDFKKLIILDLEDVPNWNLMFFNTRRIGKPRKRPGRLNRQIENQRPAPKLLTGNPEKNGSEKKITSRTVRVNTRRHSVNTQH